MRQTLFYIPHEIAGLPVFGMGWLLLLWIGGSLAVLFGLARKQGMNEETKGLLPFIAIVGLAIAFVLPQVEEQQGLPIRGYGVFLLIATVSGVGLATYRAKQVGLSPDTIVGLAFHMFIGGIVGARLFFVIQKWDPPPPEIGIYDPSSGLKTFFNIFNFVGGGLVVYGSLFGGLVAALWYLRKHKLPVLPIADLIAPSLALGLAIGRVGCLMNGCCFGGLCHQPWAITFPQDSPPYYDQHRHGLFHGLRLGTNDQQQPIVAEVLEGSPAESQGLEAGETIESVGGQPTASQLAAQLQLGRTQSGLALQTNKQSYQWSIDGLPSKSLPVHPTQIYSSINALLLCCLVLAYFPFRRRDGETFAILMGLYAITRFLLEVIRTDEQGIWNTGMTISQNVSVLILVGVACLTVYLLRQPVGSFWPREPTVASVSK